MPSSTARYDREHAPSIIFMDEVDSIGSARIESSGGGGGDSEVQRTMLELLNQLDGFEATNKIKARLLLCSLFWRAACAAGSIVLHQQTWLCIVPSLMPVPQIMRRLMSVTLSCLQSAQRHFRAVYTDITLHTPACVSEHVVRCHPQVLMATNRIDILDAALLRPGRIDRKIEFPNPNESSRFDILKIHSRKMNLMRGIDLRKIADRMPGTS